MGQREDPISAIYSLMTGMAESKRATSTHGRDNSGGSISLSYAQVEAMVLKKGFNVQQLKSCLYEYEQLCVLYMDADGTNIIIEQK
jgi:hypothetical protein